MKSQERGAFSSQACGIICQRSVKRNEDEQKRESESYNGTRSASQSGHDRVIPNNKLSETELIVLEEINRGGMITSSREEEERGERQREGKSKKVKGKRKAETIFNL